MTAVQPGRKRAGFTIRAYLGTCVICRCGAYEGDDVVRGRGRWLGLLHAACAKTIEETK